MHKVVQTPLAPAAIGPYSQARIAAVGQMIFCSGQIPLDPNTGELIGKSVAEQTSQAMDNVRAVLGAAGATLADVVKTTVFLTDMATFSEMNEVYQASFQAPFPARSTIGVATLPRGARVEIEVIAVLGANR